jgi:hypothetical protein
VTGWRVLRRHGEVGHWRKVVGRIRTARAVAVEDVDRRGNPVTRFEPLVLYDYAVAGEDYVGTRIGLAPAARYATRDEALGQIRPYPEGRELEVLIDPARPNHALLDPRLGFQLVGPALACLGLLALVAFLVVVAIMREP